MIITGNGQGGSTTPGAVTSVANSDGTLTVSPGTGAVVASIALAHANTWTGVQTFNNANGIKIENTITGSSVILKTGGTLPVTWTLPTATGALGAALFNNGSNTLAWAGVADTLIAGGFQSSGPTLGFLSANSYTTLGLEGAGGIDNAILASDDSAIAMTITGHSATHGVDLFQIYNHPAPANAVYVRVGAAGGLYAALGGPSFTGSTIGGTAAAGVFTAGTPAQAASTVAGLNSSFTASNAVAGTTNAGAAAGGAVAVTAGNAAQKTSGNANGGSITLTPGTGVGTGTPGNIVLAGHVTVPTGAAGLAGTATLNLGTVTVNTTSVTASSIIMVCYNTPQVAVTGILSVPVASITPGTSFVINSTDATDSTSTVNWFFLN